MSGSLLLALLSGLVLLFALAIAFGLRSRKSYFEQAAQSTNADLLWSRFGRAGWDRASLIYGIPTDFSMSDAGWTLKDAHDRVIGEIHRGMGTTTITLGAESFRVNLILTLGRSAELRRVDDGSADPASLLCSFEMRGGLTSRVARFTPPKDAPLEVPIPMGWPREVYPMYREGKEVGARGVLNANRPMAKWVVAPADVVVRALMIAV